MLEKEALLFGAWPAFPTKRTHRVDPVGDLRYHLPVGTSGRVLKGLLRLSIQALGFKFSAPIHHILETVKVVGSLFSHIGKEIEVKVLTERCIPPLCLLPRKPTLIEQLTVLAKCSLLPIVLPICTGLKVEVRLGLPSTAVMLHENDRKCQIADSNISL